MLEWMMAHPWMTLILMLAALAVLDDIVYRITQAISAHMRRKRRSQSLEVLKGRELD